MGVLPIMDDCEFHKQVSSHTDKLVVIVFSASWCGPCRRIAPAFELLSRAYPRAVFFKVDVDVCQETSMNQGVTSMPTFIFYRNTTKIETMSGANPRLLEEKIRQYYGTETEVKDAQIDRNHTDLAPFIMMNQCEALNESDSNPLANCLEVGDKYLESGCDSQLILSLAFTQAVKIHSILLKAPASNGPKHMKLFINQPHTLDFDEATTNEPNQTIDANPDDLVAGNAINLNFVRFQNVQNIHIFVQNNQDGSDITRIDHLKLVGSPVMTTKMSDFKRVAGKEGEVHV